jgi:PAS domain S-box-containing protein
MSRLGRIGGDVESALEDVSVPSYVIDRTGVIVWVNAAAVRIVGDVRGKQFTSVVAPEETQRSREIFARNLLGTAQVSDNEVVVVDSAGARLPVEISSVPLRSGERVIGVFGIAVPHPAESVPEHHHVLTARQAQVLRMLARGFSTAQIAAHLHLSVETVRNHVAGLLRRLEVHSRLEAVALARQEGLLVD